MHTTLKPIIANGTIQHVFKAGDSKFLGNGMWRHQVEYVCDVKYRYERNGDRVCVDVSSVELNDVVLYAPGEFSCGHSVLGLEADWKHESEAWLRAEAIGEAKNKDSELFAAICRREDP